MALVSSGALTYTGTAGPITADTIDAYRERFAARALVGASGTVSVALIGGVQLTGTVDVSQIGAPDGPGAGGGMLKLTVSTVVWLIPLASIVALGQ